MIKVIIKYDLIISLFENFVPGLTQTIEGSREGGAKMSKKVTVTKSIL